MLLPYCQLEYKLCCCVACSVATKEISTLIFIDMKFYLTCEDLFTVRFHSLD